MALSYAEYKNMNNFGLIASKAALEASQSLGLNVTNEEMMAINELSITNAGLADRPADVISAKNFLGFMLMIGRYPSEFLADIEFWTECHSVALQMINSFTAGMDADMVAILMSDPEVTMIKRFLINPSAIIKG